MPCWVECVRAARTFKTILKSLRTAAFFVSLPVYAKEVGANKPLALSEGERSRIAIYEEAIPAVVILEVEVRADGGEREGESDPAAAGRPGGGVPEAPVRRVLRSEGSGFVVRSDGVIVTNRHVVAGAKHITVRFRDNRRMAARFLGEDERADVAVVRVDARNLPFLEFGDSDAVRVGQSVYAIGAPFGQEWSFSAGMLSGRNRTRLLGPSSAIPLYEDYLQTDAFVNSGHSGGPLLDSRGKVVGMNTLIARADRGLAFAVPSNFLAATVNQILETGSVVRPWYGFRAETLGETAGFQQRLSGAESGAVILAVEPESPAVQADLRPADVVQTVDGLRIHTSTELQREIFNRPVGRSVKFGVWRYGSVKTLSLVPRSHPDSQHRRDDPTGGSGDSHARDGHFGLVVKDLKGGGVRVDSVESGSVAALADIQSGDVFLDVEGRAVKGVNEFFTALASALKRNHGGALVQVDRHGRRLVVLVSVR
jgi:serine protease Do